MFAQRLAAAVAALLIAGAASAATTTSTGDFFGIAAPVTVTNGTPISNTNILYFNEMQNVLLGSALTTDQGVIAAGTRVDSHMFFLNRRGDGATLTLNGTLSFASAILGTMSDRNGLRLLASDWLGFPTTYTNFNGRGLEGGDSVTFVGNTITATLNVKQPGDWVRVITIAAPVPVPAGILLLPFALGALGAMRRRRKAA